LLFRWRSGDFTATHKLLLVASASQRAQSYARMSELLDLVAGQALGDRAVSATPADVETSDQSTYLTAYELTWTERVRQTTEGTAP
jgi:hypothetical protein